MRYDYSYWCLCSLFSGKPNWRIFIILKSIHLYGVHITKDLSRNVIYCRNAKIILILEIFKGIYSCLIIIGFTLIPFTYFYGEERQDFLDIDFEIDKKCSKIWNSLKYTVKTTELKSKKLFYLKKSSSSFCLLFSWWQSD